MSAKILDIGSRIKLAKILSDNFNEGDWVELFLLCNCKDVPEGINNFWRHVHWNNPEIKGVCIEAINSVLDKDSGNILNIWEMDRVQRNIKIKDENLYYEIESIIKDDSHKRVSSSPKKNTNENIYKALEDAEILIEQQGPQHAYDRMHTALHGTLKQICSNNNIDVKGDETIQGLLSLINTHLKTTQDSERNIDVFHMLRSAISILKTINELRNHNSLAHPGAMLLNEADAKFAINLVRSIMSYVDDLI
ncbi:abortive infection family protein [Rahnella sp. EDr1-12]|uniref:abortive infection family protein n=1 Tax=unclassified Rahnella TaxID=2635087 RepID=UPI003BAC495E